MQNWEMHLKASGWNVESKEEEKKDKKTTFIWQGGPHIADPFMRPLGKTYLIMQISTPAFQAKIVAERRAYIFTFHLMGPNYLQELEGEVWTKFSWCWSNAIHTGIETVRMILKVSAYFVSQSIDQMKMFFIMFFLGRKAIYVRSFT